MANARSSATMQFPKSRAVAKLLTESKLVKTVYGLALVAIRGSWVLASRQWTLWLSLSCPAAGVVARRRA